MADGISWIGEVSLLDRRLTGLLCSQRCPGGLILPTYDLARALRDRSVALIGGFQTGLEAECLTLLLRGGQPVVVCPNRSVEGMRVPPEWREPVASGRLLVVSPFALHERRKTRALGERRNTFVVEHAARVVIPHASAGGAVERAARLALESGKPVFTLEHPANAHLVELGAVVLPLTSLVDELTKTVKAGVRADE